MSSKVVGIGAGMTWVIDEFAAKRFIPDNDCTAANTPLVVPPNLWTELRSR
ncbi:MAG: hypothetical protein WKF60_12685 [Ilumatobacter sp.]